MCASENEQKQWIAKLSKKIPKRGIVSQHDQTTSSRFVGMIPFFFVFLQFIFPSRIEKFPLLYPQEKTEMDFASTTTIITILSNHSCLTLDKFPDE